MAGFKSFAERLELPLMNGVTAVVGPNGTGKSNLVDAVRWALGEQRPRALRAERMEDLLFAGADRKRPAGMAECAVTLDNRDDRLGVGSAEVEVRRRLYRSGDSDYLVNRRPARLRDVERVMRAAGLASGGYAIVSQGRVDEVLRARAGERLRMLEEAAGIGALEVERERAVAALGEGAAERARLEAEIEAARRRAEELAAQAERAVEDRRLGKALRTLELALGHRRRSRLQRRALALSGEAERAAAAAAAADTVAKALVPYGDELSGLVRDATRVRAHAAETGSRTGARAQAVRTRLEAARARAVDYERSRREIEQALAATRERQDRAERTAGAWAARLPALEAAAQTATAAAASLPARTAGEPERAAARAAEARLKESEAALARAEREVEAVEARSQSLDAARGAQEAALESARDALAEAERAWEAAREGLAGAREAAQGARERWLEAQAAARAGGGGGLGRGTQLVLEGSRRGELAGVVGALGGLVQPAQGLEVAIDTALGGAAADLVVERGAQAEEAVAYLRAHGGRATFLPLDTLRARSPEAPPVLDGVIGVASDLVTYPAAIRVAVLHRLGGVWVVERLDQALALGRRTGMSHRIVTRDGDVVATGGAITGGTARAPRLGRAVAAGADVGALRAEADAAGASARAAEIELGRLDQSVRAARHALVARERAAAEAAANAVTARAGATSARERRDALVSAHTAALAAWDAARPAAEAEAAETVAEGTVSAVLEAAARAAREVGEARGGQTAALAEARRAQSEVEALERRAAALGSVPAVRTQADEAALAAMRRLQDEASTAAARAERLVTAAGRLRTRAEITATAAQGEARASGERAAGLSRERDQARASLAEEDDRLCADFGPDAVDEATRAAAEVTGPDDELAARAEATRRSRGALGPVWQGAEAAHAAALRQLEAVTGELEALEEGRRALIALAGDVRRRMDRAVADTLERVRQRFATTVTALLGGSGELAPVETEGGGPGGLEIAIALPGKRRTALTGLSGGERSLGAMAFLFSLLAVRPSALVLLDEVEAALDPANAGRFARYLRSASVEQQFLVITHQRPTMEAAHALWGFTAQEAGVSHLVTVRLDGRPAAEAMEVAR